MPDDPLPHFRAVFDAEYRTLLRSAFAVTADWALAEDAVQDAFVELFVHWRKASRYESVGGWLRLVTLRKAARPGAPELGPFPLMIMEFADVGASSLLDLGFVDTPPDLSTLGPVGTLTLPGG